LNAIFKNEAFYSSDNRSKKLKSPFEFVVSSLRLLGADVHVEPLEMVRNVRMTLEGFGTTGNIGRQLSKAKQKSVNWRLVEMGQPLFSYPPPTGYPEDSNHWQEPGLAMQRMNFSMALMNREIPDVRLMKVDADLSAFVGIDESVLADVDDPSLRIAAMLASPEFQYR
jgi:uncharacterized protein (DUF1800 family)